MNKEHMNHLITVQKEELKAMNSNHQQEENRRLQGIVKVLNTSLVRQGNEKKMLKMKPYIKKFRLL